MDQSIENPVSSTATPAKRGKSFLFYIILIGINFSLFTFFALIWVGMSSFNNIIPWEGWIVILVWVLLLGSLILSLFKKKFAILYLIIEALVIVAFTALSENYGISVFALLSLFSVFLPTVFLFKKSTQKTN
jgi:hypothetical protein